MSVLAGCRQYRLSLLILVLTLVIRGSAEAEPRKYTVFDLAPSTGIPVIELEAASPIKGGTIFLNGSALPCQASRKDSEPPPVKPSKLRPLAQLVVDYDASCPLFTQSAPSKFIVMPALQTVVCMKDEATPECTRLHTFEFEAGDPISGTYGGHLWMQTNVFKVTASVPVDGCAARWTAKGWKLDNVELIIDGTRVRTSDEIADLPRQGAVYLRAGKCEEARRNSVRPIVVNYTIEQKTSGAIFPSGVCDTYADAYEPIGNCPNTPKEPPFKTYKNAKVAWVLYVDQATEKGIPRITYNPNNYVLTNSFGRIRVRHWKNVTPALNTSGSGTALTTATLEGGIAVSESTPLITGSLLANDGEALVTEFLVPPHAPGTMHLLVKFTDVDDPTKPRGEAGTDLIVDRSYSSALRFGIAHIVGLHEIQYKGIRHEEGGKFVITKRSSEPNEIVLGYALYLDWLLPRNYGRTYNLIDTSIWGRAKRHLGLYAGFGAVSYASGSFDYLKSFHLGLEFEVKNFSVAATIVTRRTPSLNGSLHVGDEVLTGDIDTVDQYRLGFGIVVNFSLDFLRFTAGGIK